jgi:5'-3' exonuclease
VPALRKLAVKSELAIPAVGCEADDLMRTWAGQVERAGHEYIICSIDKDLLCIPGKHYRMREKKLITVSHEEAMRHYYEQLLKGDGVDNIPGIPGIGVVKATKILKDCKNEGEFQETVVGQYLASYGDDWYSHLLSNAKLIHLQHHPDDYFSFENWPVVKELA